MDDLLFRQIISDDTMTDMGNASRLARLIDGKWRYVHELGSWFYLKDGLWERDEGRHRFQLCRSVVQELKGLVGALKEENRMLAMEAQGGSDELAALVEQSSKAIADMLKWVKACSNVSRINAMLDLVRSEPDVSVSIKEFDSKGHYLRVKNGVIDLRDSTFSPATPDFLMLRSCSVAYDPDAECPNWLAMVGNITQGDKEYASFLARLAGQALLGSADKDQLFLCHGSGGNGKSTFTDTLHRIMGSYAKVTNPELITGRHQKAEYYLAELAGVRLLLMSESGRGDQLTEAMIKRLVDSGSITARVPAGKPFEFQPVATPILATNHLPYISSDAATWRRLTIVPFTYQVPVAERQPGYRDKLVQEEGSGILNWMLEGCLDYQWQGLNPPDVVIEAKERFQREANRVAMFMDECTVRGDGAQVSLQELRSVFDVWAKENGFRSMGRNLFSEELGILGLERRKSTGGLYHVRGVKLHPDLDYMLTMSSKDRIYWKEFADQVLEF